MNARFAGKLFGGAAAAVVGLAMANPADALVTVGFDPTGSGSYTDITGLDWANGNVLSVDSIPTAVGTEFTSYYQARLQGFEGSTLNGGDIVGEITIVAAFRERVTSLIPLGPNAAVATFEIINHSDNFIRIYHDVAANASDDLGTGFNDGVLILEGTPLAGGDFDNSFIATDALSGFGSGTLLVTTDIDSYDSNYFDFGGIATFVLRTISDGNITAPFQQVAVGDQFVDKDGNIINPDVAAGGFNGGIRGNDFHFEADVATSFNVIPEPVSAALGFLSLGALGMTALRRRR